MVEGINLKKYLTICIFFLTLTALISDVKGDANAQHYMIISAYSVGDKVIFTVEENGSRLAFLYDNRNIKRKILDFNTSYQPVHWNGAFWLLKKGNINVTLAIWNGSLRILKQFKNGTLCNNNVFVKWNGNEYLIQFIQGPSRCGLGVGGREHSKLYILRKERLYPLAGFDGTASVNWLKNRWFIIGNGTLYAIENCTLQKIGNVRGQASLVAGKEGIWMLTAERLFNASNLEYMITVYRIETSHLENVFSEEVDGIVEIPKHWRGSPVFVLKKNGYYHLMVFNETFKRFFDIRVCKGDYFHIIPHEKSVLALCGCLDGKIGNRVWSVFRVERNIPKNVAVFKNKEWPYIYDRYEVWGFPALNVRNGAFLVVSGFAFNATTVMNLLTGKKIMLPKEIREKNYKIIPYRDSWMVFTEDRIYLMDNTRFVKIVLKEHVLSSSSENPVTSEKMYILLFLFAVVLVFILQWQVRK